MQLEEPIEIKNLFNPAFLSTVLSISVSSYEEKSKKPFPYVLAYITLPLVLHKKTREIIPNSARSKLHKWINMNQQIKVDIENKIIGLKDRIKSAILFGCNQGLFEFQQNGRLHCIKKIKPNDIWNNKSEIIEITKKAAVLGKLFASIDALEIYVLLGVRP